MSGPPTSTTATTTPISLDAFMSFQREIMKQLMDIRSQIGAIAHQRTAAVQRLSHPDF